MKRNAYFFVFMKLRHGSIQARTICIGTTYTFNVHRNTLMHAHPHALTNAYIFFALGYLLLILSIAKRLIST